MRKYNFNRPSTKEEIARADARRAEDNHGLSAVSIRLIDSFRKDGLHDAFIFYAREDDSFWARLFYEREEQIEAAETSGLSDRIREAVREELEDVGRGQLETLKVNCQFESHEQVMKTCNGDYLTYLR